MTIYTCPNGHRVEAEDPHLPTCHECKLIATWGNTRTGEAYNWTPIHVHEENCRRLQEEVDAAFDHQYFDER